MVVDRASLESLHYQPGGGVPSDFLVSGIPTGEYCYYRMPNGEITIQEIGKNNERVHAYQDEGWTPLLREYGAVDFLKEYYCSHPHEVLFMRGGAHEMPVSQIQALGYDRRPPLVPRCTLQLGTDHQRATGRPVHFDRCWQGALPVHFPQLDGLTPVFVGPCEFCERDDFASARAREQHMRVMHKDEIREITTAREMAKGMREAVGLAVSSTQGGRGIAVAGMAAHPYACGFCDATFEKARGPVGLEEHIKLHQEIAADEE